MAEIKKRATAKAGKSDHVISGNNDKHPVIDNRKYPSSEEVGRILRVPAKRVRQLKELAEKLLKAEALHS
jgi:hypothetical protein